MWVLLRSAHPAEHMESSNSFSPALGKGSSDLSREIGWFSTLKQKVVGLGGFPTRLTGLDEEQ